MDELIKDIEKLVPTVRSLLKSNGREQALKFFLRENISFIRGYDDFNRDYCEVKVKISPEEFVELKNKGLINKIESAISEAINDASLGLDSNCFFVVHLYPREGTSYDREIVVPDFWEKGYFKIFISHTSEEKASAVNLKTSLAEYGISAFVAHEDITPSVEWLPEIKKALRTMDCFCAIISEKFIQSEWCDQEVGFAIGRNVMIIPIMKEQKDPYGFLGSIQALRAKSKARDVAYDIFRLINESDLTKFVYQNGIVNLFVESDDENAQNKWLEIIEQIPSLHEEVASSLSSNFLLGLKLTGNELLTNRVNLFLKKHGLPEYPVLKSDKEEDLPF